MRLRNRKFPVAAALRTALVAATVSLAPGCTQSAPVGPVGILSPSSAAGAAVFDTGAYPTIPAPPPLRAGSRSYGILLEGHRMANYVVVPSQVDPGLTRAIPQNTNTLKTADELPDPLDADDTRDFVVGFSTARSSAAGQVLLNIVLRFTSAAVAADVAADTAALNDRPAGTPHRATMSIPGHGATVAFASETVAGAELHSVTAHGPYVLLQYVRSKTGIDATIALASKTLDLQEPLIDRFVPDDPSRFADLLPDDTGMLSRTLPITPDDPGSPATAWVYQPGAALHFQENPDKAAAVFARTGVVAVSTGKSTVYEAADPPAAAKLIDELAAARQDDGYQAAAPVVGLPTARCFNGGRDSDASPRNFYCAGLAGRYAYEIFSSDERDAHQQVAAQYRLLMGSDRG